MGDTITTTRLAAAATGTALPFAFGQAFRQGDVPAGYTVSATASGLGAVSSNIRTRWADGSAKFAVLAGLCDLTAGTAKTLTITRKSGGESGAALTVADLQTTGVSAAIGFGAATASWAGADWATPFATIHSSASMSSWTFRKPIGGDAHLAGWLEVRLYIGGSVEILAWVENGFLDVAGATARSGTATFTLGGVSRYSGSITLYPQTTAVLKSGWPLAHWLGSDPGVVPSHDPNYLMGTKLVPSYWKRAPSATTLNGLLQSYTPMSAGAHTAAMGSAGYQPAIGLLPQWEALYCSSGDTRAYLATEVNSAHFRSYATTWRDSATNRPVQPSLRPTWTFYGAGAGGGYSRSAGSNVWELNHHPSAGFLAYLVSGRQFHYDTLCMSAATCYLSNSSTQGSGVNRIMHAEDRGTAWMQRTFGQLAAIGGSDALATDYRALMANTIAHWKTSRVDNPSINQLGYIQSYQLSSGAYGAGRLGPWMHSWWIAANGYLHDMQALDSQSNLTAVRDWMYRAIVGYLGESGNPAQHSFTKAGQYSLKVADTQNNDPTTWYDTWGQVHAASYGAANSTATNTLEGSPDQAATGNGWGETLGAIAYAVDHGAPGAAAAWRRLAGASNFSALENSGFNDRPQFGIAPRVMP